LRNFDLKGLESRDETGILPDWENKVSDTGLRSEPKFSSVCFSSGVELARLSVSFASSRAAGVKPSTAVESIEPLFKVLEHEIAKDREIDEVG